jgi:hypothetical protein
MSGAAAAFQEGTFTGVAVGLLAFRQGEDLVNAAKRNAALGPCTSGPPGMAWSGSCSYRDVQACSYRDVQVQGAFVRKISTR